MTELQIINKRLDDLEKRIGMLDKEANKIVFLTDKSKSLSDLADAVSKVEI